MYERLTMIREIAFFLSIVAIIFCLQVANDIILLHSHRIIPSCGPIKQKMDCISLTAIVKMNAHGPPVASDSSKKFSTRSTCLEYAMPEWPKYDVEDLPQLKHPVLKFFPSSSVESSRLSPLYDIPTWPDKSKLRTLRPPVRAAPHS